MAPLLWFFLGLVALWIAYKMSGLERFEAKFTDKKDVARTIAFEDSSYNQRTNHMEPLSAYNAAPMAGNESPFQVNQFKAYIK